MLGSEHEARSLASAQAPDLIAVLPASGIGVEFTRTLKESRRARRDTAPTSTDNDALDGTLRGLPARFRAVCRAELDFAPRLTARLVGFFPSYTTTCPPPAGR